MRMWWLIPALAIGCGGGQRPVGPGPLEEAPQAAPADAAVPAAPESQADDALYPLDEAVADALSGPLTHIGTGPWHGIHRILACAYRNERVIVVNVYCTIKETRAFRIDVFSPTRGRVRIYAEAKTPISTLTRAEYFTFKAETEPAPPPEAGLPPFALTMSFAELQAYEKQRYERFLPACYGGVEINQPQGGCLRDLAPQAADWAARNEAFLARPPADWYRLVKELRALAVSR